jgi:fatty-acid peroxygenase
MQLIRQGYPWASRLRGGACAVASRLLERDTAVVGGPAWVRRFYDLSRRRAFSVPVQLVLFGPGTVRSLDDAEHQHRKAMSLNVLSPDAVRLSRGARSREAALDLSRIPAASSGVWCDTRTPPPLGLRSTPKDRT